MAQFRITQNNGSPSQFWVEKNISFVWWPVWWPYSFCFSQAEAERRVEGFLRHNGRKTSTVREYP
jgi:hypothetical protein